MTLLFVKNKGADQPLESMIGKLAAYKISGF